MNSPSLGRSPRGLWVGVLWFGVGLFDATQTVVIMHSQGMHHAWVQLFITLLFSWLPWALATPLILYLGRRFPPLSLRPLSTWGVHLATGAAANLVYAAWRASMEVAMNPWANSGGPGTFTSIFSLTFYNGLLATVVLYASVLAIGGILDSRERLMRQEAEAARLSEQLSKAQLDAVRHQIEPHFLFNSLNAVAALVREGKSDDAVSMIASLSDLLRRVLQESRKQRVALREELELLDKYLAIQKVRFSDRLRVEAAVPDELLATQVPSLVLQPLVENALKHGIAARAQGGLVRVSASRLNGHVTLTVYNDGPAISPNWKENPGVGLSNLEARLRGLYGEKFRFSLDKGEYGGVEATVSLPYSASEER